MEVNNSPINRRTALKVGGAACVAVGLGSESANATRTDPSITSSSPPRNDLKIIDPHQHLWDLEKFDLPWLEGNERLSRDFMLDEYRDATENLPIAKCVYMEVGMAKYEQTREAEFIVSLCNDDSNKTVAAVIAGQPFEDGFEAYARRFAAEPVIKGLRSLLIDDSPTGACLGEEYTKGVQLLGELDMCFDICIRPQELADGVTLVERCPDTRFVLDHCGNADPASFRTKANQWREPNHDADDWKRQMDAYGATPNTMCKVSGIIARVDRDNWSAEDLAPIVNHCREAFGADRLMFASDWPVCNMGASLEAWVKALQEIVSDWPADQQQKLFHDNAERFYGLTE